MPSTVEVALLASETSATPDRELRDPLAGELAWKLLHPQQFAESVRDVLDRYADAVGRDAVSDEVRRAMEEL